jgi:hypothetical protein
VHPGCGFLSEKHYLATAVEDLEGRSSVRPRCVSGSPRHSDAGVLMLSVPPSWRRRWQPSQDALIAMGDKIESKKLAKSAGVRTAVLVACLCVPLCAHVDGMVVCR